MHCVVALLILLLLMHSLGCVIVIDGACFLLARQRSSLYLMRVCGCRYVSSSLVF